MIMLLFGPPGVGKGTQAELLTNHYSFILCSTGNILREEITRQSDLGIKVKQYLEQGELVPDEFIFTLVEQFLTTHREHDMLFDGFPRTVNQASVFDSLLEKISLELSVALEMYLSEDEIVSRLEHRRYCSKCGRTFNLLTNPPKHDTVCDNCQLALIQRADDTEPVIRRRMKVYKQETQPLITYYQKEGIYHRISAEGTQQDVFKRITAILNGNID